METLKIDYESIEPNIGCVRLSGALDISGVQEVSLKFTTYTATARKPVIVDLNQVTLITSMGLGMLIMNAKSLLLHRLPTVLLNPQPTVEKVIRMSGLDQILPIEYDLDSALKRIKAAAPTVQ
jgi:anti-anti-sigma factor